MPNVNYRGKPSQDPDLMTEEELSAAFEAMPLPARQEAMRRALDEKMGPMAPIQIADNVTEIPVAGWASPVRITSMPPESGVTSIPLGAPWPPLSREQVVKLHEGLVRFRRICRDTRDYNWAARTLDVMLGELGIHAPPGRSAAEEEQARSLLATMQRTWTHEEVAKVAEEVQSSAHQVPVAPAWLRLDWWGSGVRLPVRNVSGRDLAEGQMVTTAQVQVVPETRPPYLWTPDGKLRAMSPGEVASIVEGADGKPTFRVTQGDAMPAGTDRDYLLVASAPDVPRRQEGQWEEPPKRNCWTCKHSHPQPGGLTGFWCSELSRADVDAWTGWHEPLTDGMPPKDSDGCPGWERKP